MSPPLRLAMVGLRAPWGVDGGVEQAVGELAPRLVAAGVEVTVYCRAEHNPLGEGVHHGVSLRNSPTLSGRGVEALVHSAIAVPRASVRHDLVHVHACGPALFAGVPALFGRRAVVTLHGKDWERPKWGPTARTLLRAGAEVGRRAPDAVIGVSEEVCAWAGSHRPVFHIPNGVAPHVAAPWDAEAFPDLVPGEFLLTLGRLVPEKGLDVLIEAVRALPRPLPVVVAGAPADTEAWVERLRAHAPAAVRFVGPRHGAEKAALLTHARAFVFPSRVEGLSIALLEALAAGLPTIASDIPGNREVLGEVGGWRVPAGDVRALAEAMEAVARTTAGERAALGAAGRARVETHFGWEAATTATLAVYRQVCGRPGG